MANKILRASVTVYRVLLHLYPAEHRQAYGEVMVQTFRDVAHAAYARRGGRGLAQFWVEILMDIVVSAAIERIDEFRMRHTMSTKSVLALGLTIVFSLFTGYVNVTATEVQAPMACILLFSFVAGTIQPEAAWRWAVLIGLSIPVSTFVGLAINFQFVDPPPHFPITLVVLVIPALIAVYSGTLLNRVITSTQRRTT